VFGKNNLFSQDWKTSLAYTTLGSTAAFTFTISPNSVFLSEKPPSENLKSLYSYIEEKYIETLQNKVISHENRLTQLEVKLEERFKSLEDKIEERCKSIENLFKTIDDNIKEMRRDTKRIEKIENEIKWLKHIGRVIIGVIITALVSLGYFIVWLIKNGYLQNIIIFKH
jgi:vacuolar-type H+-ATPase subunit I/STV1